LTGKVDIDTEKFFSATNELNLIHQWARSRYAAPWAVLGAVLLRVSASTSPGVQLPGIIGGPASLNMIAAFASPSGGGKGISDKVGRLAWPAPIIERPIGSGEGIAALFAPPKKEGVGRIKKAIINVTEIDTLAGIAARQGSILLAQLKAAVMGELIGQSNASEATSRVVQAHTYRCCMSIGAQPGHTSVIFNDTTGGTPQRILWFPTTDPSMPAADVADPEPLNTQLPDWAHTDTDIHDVFEIKYGHGEITEQIITAHLGRQRGDADALDGHAVLTRCKVAAVLAILHHRSAVSELDWQLSAEVMAVSDRTRDWIVEQARQAARAKVRDRAVARAVGDAIYDDRVLEGVKRSIVRMLDRDGEQAGNELRSRLGKREKRDLFDQAVGLLEHDGIVERVDVERGTRFRIGMGQGDQVGQGHKPQVNQGDQVGQGDHSHNVTELDTRRSDDDQGRKLPARQWFDNHIADLRDAGHTTAESFAVFAAGDAAGHPTEALRTAASRHPDVKVISRSPRTATWDITGTQRTTYRPATAWVGEYLDGLPDGTQTIDREDFRAAARTAGYSWTAVRHAALNHDRIQSVPTEGNSTVKRVWVITSAESDEDGQAS
jgi:hypothetical protein